MKYLNFITILLLVGCHTVYESESENDITGIWLITDFTINGFDKTEGINEPHQKWVELKADGTFRSGSYKIENHGIWKRKGESNTIVLEGDNEDWCNSSWKVDVLSRQLVLNARRGISNYFVSVVLERAEELPVYKKYISEPIDRLVGFWQVEQLTHQGREIPHAGFWFRIKRGGKFTSGDDTGELTTGNFQYEHTDQTLTLKETEFQKINQWKVQFEHKSKLILTHSINSAEMHLKLVEEFK